MARNISHSKLRLRPIWQIILAVFALISVPLVVFILRGNLDFRSNANPTENPAEIVISNISDSSATISFITSGQKTKSLLNYGETDNNLANSSFDERRKYDSNAPELTKLHYHKLVNLKADTTYYFSLTIGDKEYTDTNYKFKTLPSSNSIQVPAPVNGTVEGGPFEEGVLYIHLKSGEERSSIISELLPTNGNFAINLSSATDSAGNIFMTSHTSYEVFIFSNAADKGKGAVKIVDTSSTPIITLATSVKEYNPQELESTLNISGTGSPTPTPVGSQTSTPTPTGNPTATPVPSPTINPDSGMDENSKKLVYSLVNIDSKELIAPKNIAISNATSTSFSISWTTNSPTTGGIAYGINKTPDSLTYDVRDTASNRASRYSHVVDIVKNDLKAGDIVNMIIVSNEREFINENEYLKYQVPQIGQAPSPESIEGKLTANFTTTRANKDFVILTKTSNSSWISSYVNEDLNWTISTGALLSQDLGEKATLSENTGLDFKVFGEYNSTATKSETYVKDKIIEITLTKGLTLSGLENGDQIPPGGRITGFANINSEVIIEIGTQISQTVTADSTGKWSYEIPNEAPRGDQVITISSGEQEIVLDVTIQLDELPVTNPTPNSNGTINTPTPSLPGTALDQGFLNYIYGFAILMIGLYLLRLADRKHTTN